MHTYLVVGSGGREHAIAWKLAQEPGARVVVAPGNPGIAADLGDDSCVAVPASDLAGLASLARELNADLTVVGPEAPLCAGIVDAFRAQGLPIFGPTQACAQLEASKHFAKVTMERAGIPTAAYRTFVDVDHAIEYARRAEHPLVIKADGLAGGKGVTISTDVAQSVSTLRSYMSDGQFGQASQQVVIEEFLTGPELSFMVVCDGTRAVPLATSRDHKRLQTGDLGPNTGGMGAIVPSPDTTPEVEAFVMASVIEPILRVMTEDGTPYVGFLYAGLMLTPSGPKVLEFNVRLGDPETQALLFGMRDALGPALISAARGSAVELGDFDPACCVVLASAGYPEAPQTGARIEGVGQNTANCHVFHAGTRHVEEEWQTAGGRVLAVVGRGEHPDRARRLAYEACRSITFDGMQMRTDIGLT